MPNPHQERQLNEAHHSYRASLLRHTLYKISSYSLAEDLVQDTFIRAWKYIYDGGQIEAMKAFLYRILNNLIIDEYRKHKTVSLEVLAEEGTEPAVDDEDRLVDQLDGKKAFQLLHQLPDKYHQVLDMKYREDLSLQEMSERTGESKNSLAVRIHRALAKLQEIYDYESNMPQTA